MTMFIEGLPLHRPGFWKAKKGLNDTVDTQYYNRDILTQLVDSFIQTIESQWAALSNEGRFNRTTIVAKLLLTSCQQLNSGF